jgi:hypothetical protein
MSWQRPSFGFSMVVATYTLSVAFFAWGLSTPPLDRVWQLHHELKTGRTWKLSKDDRRLLLTSMAAHPALAQSLLDAGQAGIISANRDGWIDTPHVTIVRTPRSPANLRLILDVQTPPQHIPFEIEIDGSDWERRVAVQARGMMSIELPPPPGAPELVSFKIKGDELRADPSSLAVRITFDPPQDRAESRDEEEDDE